MKQVILATGNKGKIIEFQKALASVGMEGIPLKEVADLEEPEETGETFLENALLKAHYYAEKLGKAVLTDDSGLSVDALGGAPGVYSARYAGVHGDDEGNNQKLVEEMAHYPEEERTAQYVCALAFVDAAGREVTAIGTCEGLIHLEPKGTNGFGYDPYFYVPAFKKTMAELDLEVKNSISHRGKALQILLDKLA